MCGVRKFTFAISSSKVLLIICVIIQSNVDQGIITLNIKFSSMIDHNFCSIFLMARYVTAKTKFHGLQVNGQFILSKLLFRKNHQLKADGRRSKFLVRETRERNLVQETCIQVAHRTIQVSRTRNITDDRYDKKFQILFFLYSNP